MKPATALLVLALGVASPSAAQTPASPPSSERAALAQQAIEASGGEAGFAEHMDSMLAAVDRSVDANLPVDAQRFSQPLHKALRQEMRAMTPLIVSATVKAYADNLSERELRDIIAFQTSASGRAAREKAPLIATELMQTILPVMMTRMPKIVASAVESMCAEQHCSPAERDQLIAALDRHPTPKG